MVLRLAAGMPSPDTQTAHHIQFIRGVDDSIQHTTDSSIAHLVQELESVNVTDTGNFRGRDSTVDADESSDWDTSEREDERITSPEPHLAKPVSRNHDSTLSPVQAVPPLDNTSSALHTERQDYSRQGSAGLSPSKPNTNPFRRPAETRPIEAFQDTTMWSKPPPQILDQKDERSATEPHIVPSLATEEQALNPFASEPSTALSTRLPVPTAEQDLISLEPENPWGNEQSSQAQAISRTSSYNRPPPPKPPQNLTPKHSSEDARQPPIPLTNDKNSYGHATAHAVPGRSTNQRNEHYQIRTIRWHDAESDKKARRSPVLIQNANGPCPLLALVNTLSLSTPAQLQTPLVQTLRTREQVSLGLLLEAVFDELMSGRRGATAQQLPDISELHAFLVTLHTGMNVNPRFVPQNEETQNHSTVGAFEPTREMRMYGTFAVPLVHGWTPRRTDPAFAAFSRTAATYEDAQNMQFRQEEIEQKLGTNSITIDEQAILMDLSTMKDFFRLWPTQLTEHGLESMKRELPSGKVAILFRNDHFSTVYKEPKSGQLMTLVTDAGYANHDEIVWESLDDINGSKSEMFSGDFKSVSHANDVSKADAEGWTTVGPAKGKKPHVDASDAQYSASNTGSSRLVTAAEQEDHDLALAMQLQEEIDQQLRNDQTAARRREQELTDQYISEDPGRGPNIPPRRSGPVATNRAQEDPDLPSYEQAAATKVYNPPPGHPSTAHPIQTPSSQGIGASLPATAAEVRRPPPPQPRSGPMQAPSGYRRGGNRSLRGSRLGRATPFDNQQQAHTAQEAVADRREGCSVM